ncbi:MAG: relaxase MobL [Oscillospiraceae bacterium]|nr:relaxase MobL [Oscillospiraceae bacterium]
MLSTPRVIFKCPHIKGGDANAAAHLSNYVGYISTRDGVERIDPGQAAKPATKKQLKMVERLLRDFPFSRELFEYADYQAAPTRGNASEFITRAIEDNYEAIAKRENYVDYIANRPRVQKLGAHGLFTAEDSPLVLSQVADDVAHHPGVVWLPIISLRREDAARLGYDNAERWRRLLSKHAMRMAEAMKIPYEQFRWYAAFHDEGHHPHVHMVCYSADSKSGFLTKQGIADIKSMLAKEIFQQDLIAIYQRQTQRRDELTQDAGEAMRRLVSEMQNGSLDNRRIEQLMTELAKRLQHCSGKKQYGYLPPALKSLVDEIVTELEKDPRIAAAYDLWYREREEVLRTYKDDLPERVPLSRQKEFKRIKNIVIEEAARLGEAIRVVETGASDDADQPRCQPADPSAPTKAKTPPPGLVFNTTASLLYHMGRIFQEQHPQPAGGVRVAVDSKLKRKIREKKIAMGHKPDDHEEQEVRL